MSIVDKVNKIDDSMDGTIDKVVNTRIDDAINNRVKMEKQKIENEKKIKQDSCLALVNIFKTIINNPSVEDKNFQLQKSYYAECDEMNQVINKRYNTIINIDDSCGFNIAVNNISRHIDTKNKKMVYTLSWKH